MKLYFKINLPISLLYYQTRKKLDGDRPQIADCADPLRMADAWLLQRSDARCSLSSHTDDSSPQRSPLGLQAPRLQYNWIAKSTRAPPKFDLALRCPAILRRHHGRQALHPHPAQGPQRHRGSRAPIRDGVVIRVQGSTTRREAKTAWKIAGLFNIHHWTRLAY